MAVLYVSQKGPGVNVFPVGANNINSPLVIGNAGTLVG